MKHKSPYEFLLSEEAEQEVFKKLEGTNKRPLFQYWDEYRKDFDRTKRSQSTINNTGSILRFMLTYSSLIAIEDWFEPKITSDEFHRLKNERGWSAGTFNSHRKNLSSYFLYLERMKYTNENPITRIKKMHELTQDQPTISPVVIEKLQKYLKDDRKTNTQMQYQRDRLFFALLITTGARPVELLNLTIKSFSKNRETITIMTAKGTGKSRVYPLDPSTSSLVDKYIFECCKRGYGAYLNNQFFLSVKDGTSWSYVGIRKLCERISKDIGNNIAPYMFRRFVATHLYKNQVSTQEIQHFMGHTRLSTTLRYVQSLSDMNQNGANILSGLLL